MADRVIMAVDPGGTSGYAAIKLTNERRWASTHDVVINAKAKQRLRCEEVKGRPTVQAVALMDQVKYLHVGVLIIESMYLDQPLLRKPKTIDILMPCKVGWALAALVEYHHPDVEIRWQPPSSMGVITDVRLKQWGLWIPGKKDARAALKHLMVYLRGIANNP